MADDSILNQEELDSLLGGLSEKPAEEEGAPSVARGAARRGKVKPYDFRRPDRFSKEHIRTLEMVHEGFARYLQASLSTYLRSLVDVRVTSVKQVTYDEFVQMLTNPTSLNIFTMDPLKGNGVLEMSSELMFTMIDRVLGGPGIIPKKLREPTGIEQPVVERIVVRALDSLREAWQKVAPVVPKLEQSESNPGFVQIAAPSEIVALVQLDVKVREQMGKMHLCFPYVLLEPIVGKLLTKEWIVSGQKGGPTADSAVNMKRRLADTKLGVVAVLGSARLSMKEVMSLKRGDVVRLDSGIRDALVLSVEGREKFRGKPCISNRRNSLVITEVIEPAEDLF